jgi:predicted CxxxxCH...CXXCH cytochrome family protein
MLGCDDTIFGSSHSGSSDSISWGDEPWCQVQRVFHEQCTSCHGGTSPNLEGSDAHEGLIDVESSAYEGLVFVVSGDPDGSFLYQKVAGTQGEHGSVMPLGTDGLDTDSAQIVYDWIQDGAPTDCDSILSDTGPTEAYHPKGWTEPSVHGMSAKYQEEDCISCHGEDLDGGSVGVSCNNCHETGWREDCTFCHGGTDNSTGAPPRDISNETITELLSFRTHSSHMTTHWHEAYDCTQCHTKPTDVLSVGHIFVDDSSPGESEVLFTEGLSSSGSYDGSGGCSNLYCHGDGQGNNGTVDHSLDDLSCSSCHPDSSSGRNAWDEMSGEHKDHLREGGTCSMCHGATVSPSQDILSPLLHVDGSVQVQLESGMSWSASSKSCSGECHIGDEDTVHQYAEWD